VRQTLALARVGAALQLVPHVGDTIVQALSRAIVAGADGRPVPKERQVAGTENGDAGNKKVGARTEIWIAPPKTFAASSGKDDATAKKIA